MSSAPSDVPAAAGAHHPLTIFVNRLPFTNPPDLRVQSTMTGGQIAALVDIPPDNAVVHRGKDGSGKEIPISETVHIVPNEHFVATRKHVDGGFVAEQRNVA